MQLFRLWAVNKLAESRSNTQKTPFNIYENKKSGLYPSSCMIKLAKRPLPEAHQLVDLRDGR